MHIHRLDPSKTDVQTMAARYYLGVATDTASSHAALPSDDAMITPEAQLAALARLEQRRPPLADRESLAALLEQLADELYTLTGASTVQISVQADAFSPPLHLCVERGEPASPLSATTPLQWRGAILAQLLIDPTPSPDRALGLFLRVAVETLAEVWSAERLLHETRVGVRAAIALDLHDAGKQVLPAIMLFAERAEHDIQRDPASAIEQLRTIREIAQQGLDDMAFWLGDLRGQPVDQHLAHTIERLLAQIVRAAPDLLIERRIELPAMPWQVAACLLGLLRGALANVLLHAQARNVRVDLRPAEGGVQVTLCDDGVGLNLEQALAAPGIGLESILERTRALGGRATIGPSQAGGTCIDIWLPL
jgi:signal transduction histidine kinase